MLGPSLSVTKPSFPRIENEPDDLPVSDAALQGSEAIPSLARNRDRDELVCCPICSEELSRNLCEVGGLTYEGLRIEPDLYHAGCITMMLCHKGENKRNSINGMAPEIKWGLSPVTRKPVDGFQLMPTLDDEQKLLKFVDWRSDGWLNIDSLVPIVSIFLQLTDAAAERFLLTSCKVQKGADVSYSEFTSDILPSLKMRRQRGQGQMKATVPIDLSQQAVENTMTREPKNENGNAKHLEGLQHNSVQVRLASLEALVRSTKKGDSKVIEKIWASQVDAEMSVRLAALKALTLLTDRGDQYVLDRLQEQIKACDGRAANSDDKNTKQDKVNDDILCERMLLALGEVAPKGDLKTMDLLFVKLRHNDFKIRRTATASLGKVAGKGNKRAFDAVLSMMSEANPDVRWGGVCALVHLADPGDTIAIKALAAEAKATEIFLKSAAVHALGQLVLPDGGIGEQAVKAALKDPNDQVRSKAAAAITQISEREAGTAGDTSEKSRGYFRWFGQR